MNYTTAYRPMTNGLVENKNRFIIDHVHFLMKSNPQEWDEQLLYTAAAMNSAYCRPINDIPFFVMHGRDYNFDYSKVLNNTSIPYTADIDYNVEMSARLTKAFKSVVESDSFHKDQYAKSYNKNIKIHSLTPGSLVLMRNEVKANTSGRKFATRFVGPYRILGFESTNKCYIKAVHYNFDRVHLVHTDRLKPCYTLRDTYPKFENLISEQAEKKSLKQQVKNENLQNNLPSQMVQQQPTKKHDYNLRSNK
jgi:hypothetical protein